MKLRLILIAIFAFPFLSSAGDIMGMQLSAEKYPGADWVEKLTAADNDCRTASCDLYVPSSVAGVASGTWVPRSGRRYMFAPGQFSSSACPMVKVQAGTQQLTIEGAGPRTTRFVTTTPECDVFVFDGSAAKNINDIELSGLSVESSIVRSGGDYFRFRYTQPQVSIRDFTMVRPFVGIDIDEGSGVFFVTRGFVLGTAQNGRAIWIRSSSCCFYFDTIVANAVSESSKAIGVEWDLGDDVRATNLDFVKYASGLKISPVSSKGVHHGFFLNFSADTSNSDGIRIGDSGGTVDHMMFVNCWSSTSRSGGSGVYFGPGVRDAKWIGGSILNNNGDGIVIETKGSVEVANATISGNSAENPYRHHGVRVASGSSDFNLSGNRIGVTAELGDTQAYGVVIEPGLSDNYQISGNDLRGNHSGAIQDQGKGSHKQVQQSPK